MSGTRLLARRVVVTERFRVEFPDHLVREMLLAVIEAAKAAGAEVVEQEPAA